MAESRTAHVRRPFCRCPAGNAVTASAQRSMAGRLCVCVRACAQTQRVCKAVRVWRLQVAGSEVPWSNRGGDFHGNHQVNHQAQYHTTGSPESATQNVHTDAQSSTNSSRPGKGSKWSAFFHNHHHSIQLTIRITHLPITLPIIHLIIMNTPTSFRY